MQWRVFLYLRNEAEEASYQITRDVQKCDEAHAMESALLLEEWGWGGRARWWEALWIQQLQVSTSDRRASPLRQYGDRKCWVLEGRMTDSTALCRRTLPIYRLSSRLCASRQDKEPLQATQYKRLLQIRKWRCLRRDQCTSPGHRQQTWHCW